MALGTQDVDFEEHYQNVFNELKGLTWEWVYLAIHPTFKRLNKLTIEGKNHINRSPRMVGNGTRYPAPFCVPLPELVTSLLSVAHRWPTPTLYCLPGTAGYLLSRRGAQKLLDKMFPCSLPKDQAVRILVMDGTLEAYIVKRELVVVLGQQGEGFKGSLKRDGRRKFKSNVSGDSRPHGPAPCCRRPRVARCCFSLGISDLIMHTLYIPHQHMALVWVDRPACSPGPLTCALVACVAVNVHVGKRTPCVV